MNTKQLTILGALLGFFVTSKAQNSDEALLFSQYDQGSTARFKAMGNAQTSLGGDISNISGNPAGLGFFNSSDFAISLDYFGDKNKATYFGNPYNDTKDRFGLNQLGIVFNLPNMRARGSNLDQGWINFNVGIGYTKTNSFHSKLTYFGNNPNSSIADYFMDQTYLDQNSVIGKIGWDFGLFDQGKSGDPYYGMTSLNNEQGIMNSYSGFQSETNLSFGANYSNKFYLGASIGLATIDYKANRHFYEDGFIEDLTYLKTQPNWQESRFVTDEGYKELLNSDFEYDDQVWSHTKGTGVNLKLGMIYRPDDIFRIGISATTPTWYRMSDGWDDYYGIVNYEPNGGAQIGDPAEDATQGNYAEYNLRTPYRLNGGVSAVFSRGLLSADVEFVDYASMHFSSSDNPDIELYNEQIKNSYQGAVNFKVGGEFIVTPAFLLRAGYNHQGNPYKENDYKAQSISGGLGFRFGNYYVDATYQNWRQEYNHSPYSFTPEMGFETPVASIKNTRNYVFLTIGTKF
ncbi:outer membrane protein transport protein [Olivibacter ginsenosidimutans]|uniref:Outer membrane protein transport protein n=1 Tax=Olivibacter ginsenosidimutans TaxID=1176537 RepID=A0ABP9B9D2_9SPHI